MIGELRRLLGHKEMEAALSAIIPEHEVGLVVWVACGCNCNRVLCVDSYSQDEDVKAEREKVASMKNAGDSNAVVIKNLFKVMVVLLTRVCQQDDAVV